MATHRKKILVLVDGSERSMKTVDYVGKFMPPSGLSVVLFHVFDPIPECYWDLEKEPQSLPVIGQLKAWEMQKRNNIESFMENARALLVNCGFDPASVETKIENRKQGVARDIVREAENGYDAVVFRRRGFSFLESIILGGVANKLLSKITFVPLIIAGQFPPVKKILLALDGSDSSDRVVEFVGRYLGGGGYKAVLFNVIRGLEIMIPEHPELGIPEDRFRLAKTEMKALFADYKKRLIASGFDSENISEKIVTGELSRSGAIVREANNGCYGTIAMGRRGISKVEAFFMGRVSSKVIHGCRYHAMWVV